MAKSNKDKSAPGSGKTVLTSFGALASLSSTPPATPSNIPNTPVTPSTSKKTVAPGSKKSHTSGMPELKPEEKKKLFEIADKLEKGEVSLGELDADEATLAYDNATSLRKIREDARKVIENKEKKSKKDKIAEKETDEAQKIEDEKNNDAKAKKDLKDKIEKLANKIVERPHDVLTVNEEKFKLEHSFEIETEVNLRKKVKENLESAQHKRNIDAVADKIIAGTELTDTLDKKTYEKHKVEIDARVKEKKEIAKRERIATLQAQLAGANILDKELIKSEIEKEIRPGEGNYKPLAEDLARVLNNEEYSRLKNKSNLSDAEKDRLNQFKDEEKSLKDRLNEMGPAGVHFAEFESARHAVAKSSVEYNHSYKRKFLGARFLYGVGNILGITKGNGTKATAETPAKLQALHSAQARHDSARQNLMHTLTSEEYEVHKAWQESPSEIASHMRGFLNNENPNARGLKQKFFEDEYKKLEDLKYVMQSEVKKNAMQKFTNWYGKTYWNSIKNPHARKIAQRLTNTAVISGIFLPFGPAGWAIAGGVFGYRMLRSAICGVAAETAATVTAGIAGGKTNEKGEFIRFANDRDTAFRNSANDFTNNLVTKIENGIKPEVTASIVSKLKEDHEKTMSHYLDRNRSVRTKEMRARLIFGVLAAEEMWRHGWLQPDMPQAAPIPVPKDDGFHLHEATTEFTYKGAVDSFKHLKHDLIDANRTGEMMGKTDAEVIKYMDAHSDHMTPMMRDLLHTSNTNASMVEFAEKYGFYLKPGIGNMNIESASVPKGSFMIVNEDPITHKLGLVIRYPDGSEHPMEEGFVADSGQATYINTDGYGHHHAGGGGGGDHIKHVDADGMPKVDHTKPDVGPDTTVTPPPTDTKDFWEINKSYDFKTANGVMAWLTNHHIPYTMQGDGMTSTGFSDAYRETHLTALMIDGTKYWNPNFAGGVPQGELTFYDINLHDDATGLNHSVGEFLQHQHNLDEIARRAQEVADANAKSAQEALLNKINSNTGGGKGDAFVDKNGNLGGFKLDPIAQVRDENALLINDLGITRHLFAPDEPGGKIWESVKGENFRHVMDIYHGKIEDDLFVGKHAMTETQMDKLFDFINHVENDAQHAFNGPYVPPDPNMTLEQAFHQIERANHMVSEE